MKNGNISAGRLRLFGGALKWAAYLIWLLVFGPIDRLNRHSGDLGAWLEIALGFVLGTLVWKAGHRYSMLAKKHSSPSADDLVAKDPRPPVIYLRSFLDDSVAAKEEPQWVDGASGGHPYPGPTEEEQLRNIMNQIGPFIAIGNPSEKLPELGAARAYISGDEWKDRVLAWMLQAKLVVLRAGTTEGFWWEAETVAKNVKPERIIFFLPLNVIQYQAFRRRAETFLPCHLPDYPRKKRSIGSIQGILFFESDWTAHFLEPRSIGSGWSVALKMTLEPVFKQLGVAWKKPWEVYFDTIKVVLILLGWAFLIGVLLYAVIKRFWS